jgi:hypothetical protein
VVVDGILKGQKRDRKLPLEAELVFGDVIDEIDLIVEGESASQRRQRRWVRGLRGFLSEAPNEAGQRCHRSLSHCHLSLSLSLSLSVSHELAGFLLGSFM